MIFHRHLSFLQRSKQRGFTFVEMAVVLTIASLLSWASFNAYETLRDDQDRSQARVLASELQAHLRAFSMRYGRLPCPDFSASGTGLENSPAPCTGSGEIGWFPYISLGLVVPEEAWRARYGVFRVADADPQKDADLAVAKERTNDPVSDVRYQDVSDLIVALNNAAGMSLSTSHPYLTGDGGAAGPVNCAGNGVLNVAYWLVIPLKDRSGDGARLDPPQTLNGRCVQSPTAAPTPDNDDVVLSESPVQLAGWLRRSLP